VSDIPPPDDCPSPNFNDRRGGVRPDLVVLHYTGMDSTGAALNRLRDPEARVSAHYLISKTGAVVRLVAEDKRAWHAGAGAWGDVKDVNSRSIGIELANSGCEAFPEPQMASLERLMSGIMERHAIPPERVIGHSDMAPGRKRDPGPRFDWRRLARRGLSVWPGEVSLATHDQGSFREFAYIFGYPTNIGQTELLRAFRMRFRSRNEEGDRPDETDIALIRDLAYRFPVDRTPRIT